MSERTAFVSAGGGSLGAADVFPLSPFNSLLAILGKRDNLVSPKRLQALIESELPCQRLEQLQIPCYVVATDVLEGTSFALPQPPRGAVALALHAVNLLVMRLLPHGHEHEHETH